MKLSYHLQLNDTSSGLLTYSKDIREVLHLQYHCIAYSFVSVTVAGKVGSPHVPCAI